MRDPVNGTWSLILGVSGGMGGAAALALAEAGSNIAGVHFDTASRLGAIDELAERVRKTGVQAHFFNENASSDKVRGRLIADLSQLTGPAGFRVFLHSLAFGSLLPYLPLPGAPATGNEVATRAQMDMTLTVMAHSLVYWTQDLVSAELLGPGAKVLAMTSAGTARVARSYGMVSAAKCALESHVRQLAVELAPRGVSVNALRAGITLTESFLRIPESGELSERARTHNPHRRLTTPEDVAEAVVLLAHTRSSWITGNVIGVDGGEILTV